MKNEILSNKNGITLIALVVTIIVLLILAGVTIATLMGDNGILTRANSASVAQIEGQVNEEVKLAVQSAKMYAEEMSTKTATGWLASGNIGETSTQDYAEMTTEQKMTVIGQMRADLTVEKGYIEITNNGDGTIKVTYQTDEYKQATNDTNAKIEITITVSGNTFTIGEAPTTPPVTPSEPSDPVVPDISDFTFNTEATARNTDKYGNVVTKYTKKVGTMSTNVWRLFYQDDNYTYIITDELIGSYKPSDYYTDKYSSGADVDPVGQKLNSKISTLFNVDNENPNILATAWLTDPEEWSDYANEDALFAIGAPTAELFAASYNNSIETTNTIEVDFVSGNYGYTENTGGNWLTSDLNDGIYNKDGSTNWWLASPNDNFSSLGLIVGGSGGCFGDNGHVSGNSYAVRPIVCIPTSVFNSKYLNTAE